jgi:hypothetical protein
LVPVYNDIRDRSFWTVTSLDVVAGAPDRYKGGAFDGRYLYLASLRASGPTGRLLRFDTTASLQAPSSWALFDIAAVDPNANTFHGAAFDGTFIYYAARSGVWARVDTHQVFEKPQSWSTINLGSLLPDVRAFHGIVFDGRYLYGVPFSSAAPDGGQQGGRAVARFDATQAFGAASSWTFFDITTLPSPTGRFHGGAFDGRYVYFVPHFGGALVRYDTTQVLGTCILADV